MSAAPTFGPFTVRLVRKDGPTGPVTLVRIERRFDSGETRLCGLFDVRDIWHLMPALQHAQTRTVTECLERSDAEDPCSC